MCFIPKFPAQGLALEGGLQVHLKDQWLGKGGQRGLPGGEESPGGQKFSCSSPLLPDNLTDPRCSWGPSAHFQKH